jgi:hypothetical protein
MGRTRFEIFYHLEEQGKKINLLQCTNEHLREIVTRFVSSGSFISHIHRVSGSFTIALFRNFERFITGVNDTAGQLITDVLGTGIQ